MYIKARKFASGECFADKIEIAATFFQRLIGLLGRRSLDENQGLYFPGVRSIHTLFMKFPIDVLFLDDAFTVVKKVHCLRPYRWAMGMRKTRNTLELSCGTLEKFSIAVGDKISLINLKYMTGMKMPFSDIAFKVIRGPLEGQTILLAQNKIRIGSSYKKNDLVLNVDGIVGQHAGMWRKSNGQFYIQNLCDDQEIIVNGAALGKKEKAVVHSGSEIDLGVICFQFMDSASHIAAVKNAYQRRPPDGDNGVVYKRSNRGSANRRFIVIGGSFSIAVLLLFAISSLSGNWFGSGKEYPMGLSETPIPLPAEASYGYMIGEDEAHPAKAIFTFRSESSNLNLHYTAGGINTQEEVIIRLNDEKIGSVPVMEKGWGQEQVLRLPPESLIPGGENRLVFMHAKNPPNLEQWGVKDVKIEALEKETCDMAQAEKMYELGQSTYLEKEISKGNIYLAHGYYRDAMDYMKDCTPKEEFYEQVNLRADALKSELDEKYKDFKFSFIKAVNVNDIEDAKDIMEEVKLYFPDPKDERHQTALKKLEQINSMIE
jgi:uncharacterized membrane protein (UPF0127 family)